MKREMIPSFAELERHKELVPEINPAAVIAMLRIKTVSEEIQDSILDVLQQTYHLSEGKFCALIVLHQRGGDGMAPSELAEKVGVTRATISNMLQRMEGCDFHAEAHHLIDIFFPEIMEKPSVFIP